MRPSIRGHPQRLCQQSPLPDEIRNGDIRFESVSALELSLGERRGSREGRRKDAAGVGAEEGSRRADGAGNQRILSARAIRAVARPEFPGASHFHLASGQSCFAFFTLFFAVSYLEVRTGVETQPGRHVAELVAQEGDKFTACRAAPRRRTGRPALVSHPDPNAP